MIQTLYSPISHPIRNTCGPPHGRGWLGSGSSRPTACTPGLHTGVCRLQEAVGKSRQSRQSNSNFISKKKKVARDHLELNESSKWSRGLLSIFEVVREMDCLNHFWVREVHAKVPARAATKIGGGVPPQPVSDPCVRNRLDMWAFSG